MGESYPKNINKIFLRIELQTNHLEIQIEQKVILLLIQTVKKKLFLISQSLQENTIYQDHLFATFVKEKENTQKDLSFSINSGELKLLTSKVDL